MPQVETFKLPDSIKPCATCGKHEQWADLHRRPSHAQMKEHERFTRKALSDDSSLGVEDGMIHVFCESWHVLDTDGNEIPCKMDRLGDVPQDTLTLVVEEITAITATTRPNDAIANTVAVIRALKTRVEPEQAAMLEESAVLFQKALGVPVPNAGDQTAS